MWTINRGRECLSARRYLVVELEAVAQESRRDDTVQLPEMTRFDVEALANPDAIHWPGYFWLWNDVLERETLFRQLRDMDSVGAKNVRILPVPANFRPNSMKTEICSPSICRRSTWRSSKTWSRR